jgi:small subunit ribosomal protein S4
MKLFLKGQRCQTDKCAFERRSYGPGQQGTRRRKVSEYGIHLNEKQKVRRIYGVLEKQFRLYFEKAERKRGATGPVLLQLLELRLDNVVHRLGFAPSLKQARLLVNHNHFMVNGKKANIPSMLMKVGDVIEVKENSRKIPVIQESLSSSVHRGVPSWLELQSEQFQGKVIQLPSRENITLPIEEQLIVEYYSR